MKKLSVLLFFLVSVGLAQGTPDCQFKVIFTTSGTTPSSGSQPFANFNNVTGGQPACVSWRVTYQTNATSAVSVQIEGAADQVISGVHSPTGSYTALTPAAGGGSGSGSTTNPATANLRGQIVACCDYYPWIRINVNTLTTSGAGTQIALTIYGYKGTSAANLGGGGGGGGTIAATTNALKGDGAGNAVAVTGTGTNCVLVNGSSASCSSTTGNAADPEIYTPGASVTLTCGSSTAGTVTTFSPGNILPASYTALAANMAITFAGCTSGQDIKLIVKQAAAGGPYTISSGLPSGAPNISPFASAVTTYILHATGATTVAFDNVSADSGPGVCTESAAPGTPPSSTVYFWCDSTGANLQAKNPAGNISGTAFAKTAVANQPLLSFDPTTGLFTQGTVTATAVAFSGITSGTNTTAAMVVGAGASLDFASTGTINASTLGGSAKGTSGATIPLLNTANTWSAAQTNSTASAASTPALYFTGAIFSGGSGTTTFPHVLIQPSTATAATTWNTSGTAFGINAHSGVGLFADYKLDGLSQFKFISGGEMDISDGTNSGLLSARGASGELPAGIGLAGSNGFSAFIRGGTTAGDKADMLYFNQTQYFAAVEVAAVASGFSTLNLMKSGGNVLLGNGSGLLLMGGSTSSFPALKRSSTTLAFRLADDSADAPISASGATLSGATVVLSGLGSATGTPDSVCLNTNTVVRNAALTCTVSSALFKTAMSPLGINATSLVMELAPTEFAYKDAPSRMRWGFIAEQVAAVNHKLADGYVNGSPMSLDQNAILALTVKSVQELELRIKRLEEK